MGHILSIDPGSSQSAWMVFNPDTNLPEKFDISNNEALIRGHTMEFFKEEQKCDCLAIEMVASYGMPVGATVFETCVWIGRFIQAWCPGDFYKIYRKDVKMHLCQSMRAKDSNIRQAIIDKYPATGGGKLPQVGIKSQPGPLFGVSKDVWSALSVAIYFSENYMRITGKVRGGK